LLLDCFYFIRAKKIPHWPVFPSRPGQRFELFWQRGKGDGARPLFVNAIHKGKMKYTVKVY
jgi:hypothetical protein